VEGGSGAEDVNDADAGGTEGGAEPKFAAETLELEVAGGGAEMGTLSTGAEGDGVVVGVSVGTGAEVATKEDGGGVGGTSETGWSDGVAMVGVSEIDELGIGAGVEVATLAVRVSMLTVLPASSTQTTTSGAVTVT
jgi:hypothetical protein